MFGTIVVGTDWSDTAELAVARALELARVTGAQLHVVSVDERTAVPLGAATGTRGGPHVQADVVLQQTLERLGASDVPVTQHTPTGAIADALLAVARQQQADLIVLGSRGMHGARRVLGSVPNKVSHHAPCDVLIVNTV